MWPPSCSGPASGCSTESSPSGSSRSRCSTLRSPRTSATASVAERRRRGDPGPRPARPFTLHDKNGPTKRAKWCSTASSPDRLPGPHPFGDLGPVEPEPRRVRWSRPFHAPSLPSERRTGRLPSLELRGLPESRYASHTLRRGFTSGSELLRTPFWRSSRGELTYPIAPALMLQVEGQDIGHSLRTANISL